MSNQPTTRTELARDFALFLNSHPSKREIRAWVKATEQYKQARSRLYKGLFGGPAVCVCLWWVFTRLGLDILAVLTGPASIIGMFLVLMALAGEAEHASLSDWTKPLSDYKSNCAQFVRITSSRPDMVLAVDRALYAVDLEYALHVLELEANIALEHVCATAHSLVKTSAA